jgi:hypothetical protein
MKKKRNDTVLATDVPSKVTRRIPPHCDPPDFGDADFLGEDCDPELPEEFPDSLDEAAEMVGRALEGFNKVPLREGVKYDMEKPDYSLVPPNALEDTVKILTLGAQKYDRDNWKLLPNAKRRYFAAAQRHMWARLKGELKDPESGIDHCAHAICCLMFMLELEHENLDP